ncbi:thermonuclease family protein [Neobacillus drentensis]|uniref:thermonuclease family protein n=1 Tax=Neobacillus drentensis TaxID=220684 RepID=UPI001F157CE4|nr:thermonuclease family protein [Neobacillus drentensis]ULT58670.1 thermonuclease family protein [Neobacillus drentensis]
MKFIKAILIILAILFMLVLGITAPISFIGFVIFLIGMVVNSQYKKRNIRFAKGGWLIAAGIISSFLLAMVFSEPAKQKQVTDPSKTEAVNKEKEAAKKAKEKAEAEKKAKAEEARVAEEKAKAEEERIAAEKAEAEKAAQEKQAAKQSQEELAKSLGLELITVGRVVDGDTFVTSDGRKVRLIGVNTPESTTRHEQYGKEASNYTVSKLNGKQIWMQKDVSETDRYGRLLRIIWFGVPTNDQDEKEIRSKMFNADLVLNGYAEPSTYPPDVKYSDYFVKFAREAREANKGLWAFGSQGTTKGDLDSSSSSNGSGASTGGNPSNSPSSGKGKTNAGTESFKNCTEMRKVYPNGVPSTHPAYEARHDRDKDNWACEQ